MMRRNHIVRFIDKRIIYNRELREDLEKLGKSNAAKVAWGKEKEAEFIKAYICKEQNQ